jgi:hypothetical protein
MRLAIARHYFKKAKSAKFILTRIWWKRVVAPPRIPRGLEVLVVSPGGVGTTFLIEHIGRFRVTNNVHDNDGLKHLPTPPRELRYRPDLRVVFLTGDADQIYASLKRRGYIDQQGAKLGSALSVVLRGGLQRITLVRAIRRQYRRWTKRQDNKVLVLKYNDIWERIDDIANFIGVNAGEFRERFPVRRARITTPNL